VLCLQVGCFAVVGIAWPGKEGVSRRPQKSTSRQKAWGHEEVVVVVVFFFFFF